MNSSGKGSSFSERGRPGRPGPTGRARRPRSQPPEHLLNRLLVTIIAASLMLLIVCTAHAAEPMLSVTPTTVHPGQTVHVSAAGLAGLPSAGLTGCLGIIGPGQNVEQNLSPSFRPQIGTIALAADGTGQADPTIPPDLVPGSYRLIVGGCSPHGSVAPLETIAQATITVARSKPIPTPTPRPFPGLPATGGVPTLVVQLVVAAGVLAVAVGFFLRRRSR